MENRRVPRLLGVTQLVKSIHQCADDTEKGAMISSLRNLVIQNWWLSNGNLCGVNHSINQLAFFLACDVADIQMFMRDRVLSTRIWDKDIQENMVNALVGQQVAWVLEDRMDIQAQVDMLKASQGGQYRPFITGEMNKVLKLKLESTTSIQSLVRAMVGNNTVNIFNPVQNVQENHGVSYEEATTIINKALFGPDDGSDKHNDLKYIEENYPVDEFPEVVATRQLGISADKEGLKLLKRENNLIVDNYKFHRTKESEADMHEIRREVEMGIDPDDEDVEFEDDGII